MLYTRGKRERPEFEGEGDLRRLSLISKITTNLHGCVYGYVSA